MKQCMEALEKANRTRLARAQLKRDLAAGAADLAELLREPIPDWLGTEPIGRLLEALPRVGRKRAGALLRGGLSLRFPSPTRSVGALTARERLSLADVLDDRYYHRASDPPDAGV
jgi:hypothetical protein